MSEEKLSLREAKRLATHMSITDHATRLVMDHGFDAVTVEDICQAAGISRRTFFNYVDSKECAVFGAAPKEIGEHEIAKTALRTSWKLLSPSAADCLTPT